ncbi:copper transporter [Demequina globuliformis]|uniref:copper transporter n=1 Tax=Demequina globuliformis TaxID=676202 RepID=UPI000785F01B|nr:copper transporter [Demequina globuliformis]
MIDFRYHLVSLTAVFLALAVGVVLGSGPMRDALVGDQAAQIETLEGSVDSLEGDLEQQQAEAVAGEQFAEESSARLLAGSLADVAVATVEVGEPPSDDAEAVRQRQVQAGATVAAQVSIGAAWTDPGQVAFRSSLASTVASQVVGVTEDMTPTTVLAHALAQSILPGAAPVGGDAADFAAEADERAGVLFDLLAEADLVSGSVGAPAQAVTMIAGPASEDDGAQSAAYAEIAGVLGQYADGIVAASGTSSTGDLATAIANDPQASGVVSTVSTGTDYYGQISTALALAENIGGAVGQYGPGGGQTYVPTP